MDALEAIVLALAALAAGAINAVAGGGTLISFPILVAAGYSAKVANVTNTVALWPWTVGGSLGYRGELAAQPGNIKALALPTIVGSLLGSAVLLATPESAFEDFVPLLILAACGLLALQDRVARLVVRRSELRESGVPLIVLQGAIFVASVYGAYFGAGLGIIVLAVLGMLLPDDIQRSNALKGLIAMASNGVAAIYFAILADVAWGPAALMAVASLAGGYGGVAVARRLPRGRLRQVVIAYGTMAALIMLVRNFA
jgi:uncharacterized membrane protein YfcA